MLPLLPKLTGLTGRFARQQRLTQALDYKKIFVSPCAKQGDANMLVLGRKNNFNTARLGLAVAKKQLKHANMRNRFKRLTRESFRHHLELLKGFDVVVVARPGSAIITNRELYEVLAKNWHMLIKKCEPFSQA